jgi:hypothetical protein
LGHATETVEVVSQNSGLVLWHRIRGVGSINTKAIPLDSDGNPLPDCDVTAINGKIRELLSLAARPGQGPPRVVAGDFGLQPQASLHPPGAVFHLKSGAKPKVIASPASLGPRRRAATDFRSINRRLLLPSSQLR